MRLTPLTRTLIAAACLLSTLAPARAQGPVVPEGAFGESMAVATFASRRKRSARWGIFSGVVW